LLTSFKKGQRHFRSLLNTNTNSAPPNLFAHSCKYSHLARMLFLKRRYSLRSSITQFKLTNLTRSSRSIWWNFDLYTRVS
jgi:hypothetical protein